MKKLVNEQFKRMQHLAGILNEEFTKPVPPLRIWNRKNNEGNETYYITNPVGGLGTDKEVGFSKPEIEALHRLIEEWFKSQQSGFNRSEAVNTPDENHTQALVRIKKLEGFDVEISRQEGSQIKGYGVEGGGGGGICIIKVANMYQLKDDKNLKEATPTSESIDLEEVEDIALRYSNTAPNTPPGATAGTAPSTNKELKEAEYNHRGQDQTQFIMVPDDLGEVNSDDFYVALEFFAEGEMDERNFEPNKEYNIRVTDQSGDEPSKDVTFKFKSNGDKLEVDKSSIKVERDIDEIINEALRKYRKNK